MAGKDIVLVVAGNKIDRERERQVPQEEAESYANSIGGVLLGTSAKQGKGVEQAFLNIARRCCSKKVEVAGPSYTRGASSSDGGFVPQRRGGNIQVVEERARPIRPKEPDCC
mmetsp:Transcript_187/g.319  ORF Transcript_187/g.319 Transcript_187/m.319 type:complete len:112 (+) Transcript_187:551-886(+)